MNRLTLALFPLALMTNIARAQFFEIEISEVLVQPVANDHQKIELGTAHIPVDLTSTYISIDGATIALPPLALPPYSSTIIHLGIPGTSSPAHIYLPNAPALLTAGSVALFRPGVMPANMDLVSYLDWGGALGPDIAEAVQEGAWSSITDSAPLPDIGSTLANRWLCRNGSNVNGPDAWYNDTTPTLGAENDSACTYWYAIGCPGITAPSWGIPGGWDVGPWTGELYHQAIAPATGPALLVASSTATDPVDLSPLGMPGCFSHVTLQALQLLPAAGGYCHFQIAIPATPLLAGCELNLQALVPTPNANNSLGALVTQALRARIGSR